MRKIEREYRKICQSVGVDLLDLDYTGSGHIQLVFAEGFVTASSTPSDYRARHKVRADIRKFR